MDATTRLPSWQWSHPASFLCRSSVSVWPQRSSWENQIHPKHHELLPGLNQWHSRYRTHTRYYTIGWIQTLDITTESCKCYGLSMKFMWRIHTWDTLGFNSTVSVYIWFPREGRLVDDWLTNGRFGTDWLRWLSFTAGRLKWRLDGRLSERKSDVWLRMSYSYIVGKWGNKIWWSGPGPPPWVCISSLKSQRVKCVRIGQLSNSYSKYLEKSRKLGVFTTS